MLKCPECEQTDGTFQITTTSYMTAENALPDDSGELDEYMRVIDEDPECYWDEEAWTVCGECGFSEELNYFQFPSQSDIVHEMVEETIGNSH